MSDNTVEWNYKQDYVQEAAHLTFSTALCLLKDGKRLSRSGWNGSGMFTVYQPGYPNGISINENTQKALNMPAGTIVKFRPYLLLKTVDGSCVPWVPSISDILAEDWFVMENN